MTFTRIGMVCGGNTCRSPMAQVVLTRMLADAGRGKDIQVDSRGCQAQVGDPADPRATAALAARGYPAPVHIARQVVAGDAGRYDVVVVMQRRHEDHLRSLFGATDPAADIRLLRSFDPAVISGGVDDLDIADPYAGDAAGYERTLAEIEAGCRGLVGWLATRV